MEKVIEELFLATWSRLPDTDELARMQRKIGEAPSLREGLQDLLWALLNARTFQMIQ